VRARPFEALHPQAPGPRLNGIAVRFAYESQDDSGNWFRSYGNENWEFDGQGLMVVRHASERAVVHARENATLTR
jgi:nuclear transport factor 2 (NTF2) superfamily protein